MPYGRKYKRKPRKYSKRSYRRSKRKGFRKRDYTPSVKLEAYFTVGTTTNLSSTLTFSTGTTNYTVSVPYTECFDSNGTFGKYSVNYSTYKITGLALEFGFTKDTVTLDTYFSTMPYLVGVNYPSETAAGFAPLPAVLKQVDNAFNISPKILGTARYYQRFPSNYMNNKTDAVGIGVWNNCGDSAKQMGRVAFQPVNGSVATSTAPAAFGYLKMSLYVRFGSKRI